MPSKLDKLHAQMVRAGIDPLTGHAINPLTGMSFVSATHSVTLHHKDGRPLQAGEIEQGATIVFNRITGEVIAIKESDHERKQQRRPRARKA